MKRFCLILSLFALLMFPVLGTGGGLFAQNRTDHVMIGAGLMYENTLDGTIAYEHETKYHNAWEYFGNASFKWAECQDCGHICDDSFWNNYNIYGVGAAYKPCVVRGRNNHGNLRFGISANYSSESDFVTGLHAGYEHDYALRKGWQLYWQLKVDGMINAQDNIRFGAAIGIKIPTKE